jgi:uncharacterized membrane protein
LLTRFHEPHRHLEPPFGPGTFGQMAESFARFFGTPTFIIGQTVVVIAWIAVNAAAVAFAWDPYPFILLNLAFSTQSAYAAPMILLAQTRQADRDKAFAAADAQHREEQTTLVLELLREMDTLLRQNTELTVQVHQLTEEIHRYTSPRPT